MHVGVAGFGAAVALALRFIWLDEVPAGFYIDEAVSSLNVLCLADAGVDANGQRLPLFAPAHRDGVTTPVFLYLGALWTHLFGPSIASLRGFVAATTVVTVGAVYFLARRVLDARVAPVAAMAAAISPWGFPFSRVAWDPPLAPMLLVSGLAVLFGAQTRRSAAIAGALVSLSMYSYPPFRLGTPMVVAAALWLAARRSAQDKARTNVLMGTFLATFLVVSLPLGWLVLFGPLQERFDSLTILSREYLSQFDAPAPVSAVRIFAAHLASYFSPRFLLLSGDANVRHSSQALGQVSWLVVSSVTVGMVMFVWHVAARRPISLEVRQTMLLGMVGVLAAFVPAALTREGLPHALRAIGAWPFLALLAAACLEDLLRAAESQAPPISRRNAGAVVTAILVAGLAGFAMFAEHYFTDYRDDSAAWFDADITRQAEAAAATHAWATFVSNGTGYPLQGLRFYLMSFGGMSCDESQRFVQWVVGSGEVKTAPR